MSTATTTQILPNEYIHVLDKNTNITRVEVGPQIFVKMDHEVIVAGESQCCAMIALGSLEYCKIFNPVARDESSEVILDSYNEAVLKYGEYEYRFHEDFPKPFPLYPGEELSGIISELDVIPENQALRIRATMNFKREGKDVFAGDEWLIKGPGLYYPRIEEQVVKVETAYVIEKGNALRITATQEFTDQGKVLRTTGEQWLVREEGSYLPGVYEQVNGTVVPFILTGSKAVILRADKDFTDVYGIKRRAGEEWLITNNLASSHLLDIHESFVKDSHLQVLSKDEFCVITDPFDEKTNKNILGTKIIRTGECSFFLHPNEAIEDGIKNVFILGERDALLVMANEHYIQHRIRDPVLLDSIKDIIARGAADEELALIKNTRNGNIRPIPKKDLKTLKNFEIHYQLKDGEKYEDLIADVKRVPGERWMEYGPVSYYPPKQVSVIRQQQEIALDTTEGIYVRNVRSGEIRAVIGKPYMLKPHEQLYEYEIPEIVSDLLGIDNRENKSRVITYNCPFNAAVQISNYIKNTARVVFGPAYIMLQPDEIFTVHVLSGGKPKIPGLIKTLHVNLGPDFTSDSIEVETSDHARLNIKLSYNWHFRVNKSDPSEVDRLFGIQDFIGDMCTIMAGKIRAAVATVNFESFHKGFAKLIRSSIFGVDQHGKIISEYVLPKNNMVITNVDIKSVDPVDDKTKDSLKETVSLAIEMTTKSQELDAKREAERARQEVEGQLERMKIQYQSKAEESRKKLLELQSQSKSIVTSGKAVAEAKALAEVTPN